MSTCDYTFQICDYIVDMCDPIGASYHPRLRAWTVMVLALRLPRTLVASETLRWIVLSARALPVEASKCIDKKFLKPCKQHMHCRIRLGLQL